MIYRGQRVSTNSYGKTSYRSIPWLHMWEVGKCNWVGASSTLVFLLPSTPLSPFFPRSNAVRDFGECWVYQWKGFENRSTFDAIMNLFGGILFMRHPVDLYIRTTSAISHNLIRIANDQKYDMTFAARHQNVGVTLFSQWLRFAAACWSCFTKPLYNYSSHHHSINTSLMSEDAKEMWRFQTRERYSDQTKL